MQRSCSVEHAHDGIRLSQNFADGYRELSRSVSGMLHCIVRDNLALSTCRLPSSALHRSRCFPCGFSRSHQNLMGHASLRQFATETGCRDKVLRQLVAKMFRLRLEIVADEGSSPEQAGPLAIAIDATFLSGMPSRKDVISADRTWPVHSFALFRWAGYWNSF
jgi:hypothetical protein